MKRQSSARKKKVALVFGGKSGEHEVSVASAASVLEYIDRKKFEIVPVGITKQGKWLYGKQLGFKGKGPWKYVASSKRSLPLTKLRDFFADIDVVFPLLHGPFGEDGTMQGFLELVDVAYVGSGVLGSSLGMDKIIQKQILKSNNLPIVEFLWFLRKQVKKTSSSTMKQIKKEFDFPVFVKPTNMGSSVGINKSHNLTELKKHISVACEFDRKIIVEKGLENVMEVEVSVLGNDSPKASVCGEIIASNEFYDYKAKYIDGKSEVIIPAKLPRRLLREIREAAIKVFRSLDCAGLGRVDFFVNKKKTKFWVNEINTIPGFTQISMYPKLWEASGVTYQQLITKLITLGVERWQDKQQNRVSYK